MNTTSKKKPPQTRAGHTVVVSISLDKSVAEALKLKGYELSVRYGKKITASQIVAKALAKSKVLL